MHRVTMIEICSKGDSARCQAKFKRDNIAYNLFYYGFLKGIREKYNDLTSKKALTGFYTCNQMVRYDPICKDYNLKVFKFHFIISYEMSTSSPKQEYKVDQNAILYNF